jgi:hypothetical protein
LPDPELSIGINIQKGLEDDVASMITAIMGGIGMRLPGPG